jgi:hypothetical protein
MSASTCTILLLLAEERTFTTHVMDVSLARAFAPFMALWMTVSTSMGHRGCKSARIWSEALRWLSRASPSLSANSEHNFEDCDVMTVVSLCNCSLLIKWLRVEKPVETSVAEVVALMAMRMHSKIGA